MSETKTTRTVQLRQAKPDEDDYNTTLDFFHACETALERPRFSIGSAYDQWQELDEDDPDRKLIIAIRKRVAEEESMSEKDVDMRIVMYEFLQRKFMRASASWRRVYFGGQIMIENACDPTKDYLDWYPGLELFHVAAEM